ncbi:MAG TPA: EF-hand domain-containing protein, partial [Scandinavium sp.]
VPHDAQRNYEVPQDTQTTLPRGAVVEIKQEATFLLNGKPAPFLFVSVVSVPEGVKSGLSVGGSGWISGLDKFVKRQGDALPAWMQAARQRGEFNQVVTVSGEGAPVVKAGEVIGHLSLNERPYGGSQHFCHLEVFSQDTRMKNFLANKAGMTTGAAELHTLADKTRWQHREKDNTFVVAGVGGDPSPTTAERYTPESKCRRLEADGKTWYYIPDELAWMAAADVERANQFDLEKRGFMPLEQEDAPQSIFQTPKESWLRQVYGQLEALARSETRDMYSSSYTGQYQKLLKQMDLNQDGVIDAGELWRFLHNTQPHIQYQVQRFVVKHHSEWLKDGMSALWQAALDEQAKKYPDMALFNRDFINKLVWMKDVPEICSGEALWHMHPIVFLGALALNHKLWKLGTTSERYESGGKGPGVISSGHGDHGGASYGCYQLSSNLGVVQQYILQSKYKDNFLGLSVGTDAFNREWKNIAEEDKKGFAVDQHEFIKKTHYDVQLGFLAKHGINIKHKRAAIHDMIWSTSVQYGPYTDLIVKATKGLSFDSATDDQIIAAVQDYKYSHVETKFRSSPTLWPGLKSRASSEKAKLLLLIKDNAEIE